MELRIGLVGAGYWGANYIRLLRSGVGRARLVACADRSSEVAQQMSRSDSSIRMYPSHHNMLEGEHLDAVVVATPATSHAQVALDCLSLGLPVLIEKPLARSVIDGETIVAMARTKHLQVGVGHTYLFNPYVRFVKEAINRGELGNLVTARFERTGFGPVRADVGALWDLASHDVSMLNYWCGLLPDSVLAEGRCFLRDGIDDFVTASLRYSTGLFASLSAGWLEPVKVRRATISGDEAMLVFDDVSATAKVTIYKKSARLNGSDRVLMIDRGASSPDIDWAEPLASVISDFVEAIDQQRPPSCSGEAGLDVVRVLESMQNALNTSAVANLDSPGGWTVANP